MSDPSRAQNTGTESPAHGPPRALPRLLAVVALVAAPLRILAQGYLPVDDALRHAAKAVSGRPWEDILLLRPEITLDSNPGWHSLLGALHRWLGLGTVDLVVLSVVALFVLFSLGPVFLLRRPASWLLALALLGVADPTLIQRLVSGRPFILASTVTPLVCLLWARLEEGRRPTGVLALFFLCGTIVTWVHGSFYLLALPLLALGVAGRWTAFRRLALVFAGGVVVGSILTGHPLGHPYQMLLHGYLAVGLPRPAAALVGEFLPFDGRPVVVVAFLLLLAWRSKRGTNHGEPWRDPVVTLIALGWALGFVTTRFWTDWGAPALVSLGAASLDAAPEPSPEQPRRAGIAPSLALNVGAAALLLLSIGADTNGRWSDQAGRPFLSRKNPTHSPWLPDPGGIVYSSSMNVFYALFFTNPDAPWKYVLGFEPAIMPPDDYQIYSEIRRTKGATEAYLPWLRRMRHEDRLYVWTSSSTPPPVPGLEWFRPVYSVWAGRLPPETSPPTDQP